MFDVVKRKNLISIVIVFITLISLFALLKVVSAPILENNYFFDSNKEVNKDLRLVDIPDKKETTVVFGGDVMLSRTVNAKMEEYNDFTWPFLEIADYFKEADLSVINLESPFLKNSNYQVLTGSFSFKANPLTSEGLKLAGIDLVSLANNHTINQGRQGIIDTIDILEENNISHTGAGLNISEARKPAILNIDGDKYAFLSYAYPKDYSIATDNRHGLVNMDEDKMVDDILKLKAQENPPNYIIILMHGGIEYTTKPNWQQKQFAHLAIDSGADMIVGHHPHWPQIYEVYNDSPIIYSLGNLIFDQMWSEETRQGIILESTWQNGLKRLELIPTKIYDYGQVRILDRSIEDEKNEAERILNKIKAPDSGIIYER
ncbi:MAG: CapA family protein [Patescibacteria group bacterium]|jgi:poly-gamma-glutamate capsule biosynthesis protein CapA/YwtB (metallophosphatase superfamily)|nr:CapA family protein [Patescibacteria group bacterium]